jgi:hypothetical protein
MNRQRVILIPRLMTPRPIDSRPPFFDDFSSVGHAALGAAAALAGPHLAAAAALAYMLYQMREAEPLPNKIGDFGEFAAGYLATKAATG